jgi:hypothetical protein
MKRTFIVKPWIPLTILACTIVTMSAFKSTADMAVIPAILFAVYLIIFLAVKSQEWIVENIVDRHRYHISDPDKDCGCYRLDRKTGSVQYIEPKTGAMSAKQEREIADDEERMYRENSL